MVTGSTRTLVSCPLIGRLIKIGADLLVPDIPIPAPGGGGPLGRPGTPPATLLLVFIKNPAGPLRRGCDVFIGVTLLVVDIPPSVLGVVTAADFSDRLEP